ncbi:MAG TPA: hypothetical protein VF142_20380, partial [Longimicrobium sp.]
EEVSGFLRRRLGEQIRLRQAGTEARSPRALELVLRGEQAYEDARALGGSLDTTDIASALEMLARADALMAQAEAADPRWARPPIGRAWVALHGVRWSDEAGRRARVDSVRARAGRVLAREPSNARALEVRGSALATVALQPGADADVLLDEAERDLRAALAAEPSLAGAWGTLSLVLYARGRFADSDLAARHALEHDAYLEDADELLARRTYAALMAGDLGAAAEACERGRRGFPRDWRFVECRLTLLREDASRPPDAALAWRLVAQLDTLDPPPRAAAGGRAYAPIYRRVAAAAVSARAGQADSARAVLARARRDASSDRESRVALAYDEAYVLLLLGARDDARARLRAYLDQRPALRPFMARDPLVRALLTDSAGRTAP